MAQKASNLEVIFKSVIYLKNLASMDRQNEFEVVYRGKPMKVECIWQDRATNASIIKLKKHIKNLPEDYMMFLTEVSNGAVLYSDAKYGQFGFKIFGTEEMIEKQIEWKKYYDNLWQDNFIVFAEFIGDLNVLLFDKLRPSLDSISFAVIEANLLDDVKNWVSPSRSFHEWLDHLIQAQGDIYWHWH